MWCLSRPKLESMYKLSWTYIEVFNLMLQNQLKFMFSEKASKIWSYFDWDLKLLSNVKTNWKIPPHFLAFSENMNFNMYFASTKLKLLKKNFLTTLLWNPNEVFCISLWGNMHLDFCSALDSYCCQTNGVPMAKPARVGPPWPKPVWFFDLVGVAFAPV